MKGVYPTNAKGRYVVLHNVSDIDAWLTDRVAENSMLYIDIETQGDVETLHQRDREILCIGIRASGQTVIVPGNVFYAAARTSRIMTQLKSLKLTAHNGKFDLSTLCIQAGVQPDYLKLHDDTMLKHYALQPASKHALEDLCVRYFGVDRWDVFTKAQKINLKTVDSETLYKYNALDVEYLERLDRHLSAWMDQEPEAKRAYAQVMIPASNLFQWMEPTGIGFDTEYVRNELKPELEKERERHKSQLISMAHTVLPRTKDVDRVRTRTIRNEEGEKVQKKWTETVNTAYEFNPNSPQQIKDVYKNLNISLESTDEKTMSKRAESGDDFARILLDYRKQQKLLSTYVDNLLEKQEKGLIYPEYLIHGTDTGRLSSKNPNIQNIPRAKKLRKMFVPRSGNRVLVQADYSQAELRVIAALSGDPWLLEQFHNPDVDIFTAMMPDVFPDVDIASLSSEQAKDLRAKLKGTIYGLLFGRGASAIAQAIGSDVEYAQSIINTFFANATKVADYRAQVMHKAVNGDVLRSRFGRRFQAEVVTEKNRAQIQRSALSFDPQSNSSDINLISGIRLYRYIVEQGLNWYAVAFVHDAITVDVPREEADLASEVMQSLMQQTARDYFPEVPFATDCAVGTSWDQT